MSVLRALVCSTVILWIGLPAVGRAGTPLLPPAAAPASQPGPAGAASPATPPQVPGAGAPILVSEIPRKAEEISRYLRELRERLEPDARVREIEGRLPQTIETIREMKEGPGGKPTPDLSLRNLEDIRRQWQLIATQIDGWRQSLAAQGRELDMVRADLLQMRETWRRAEALARKEKAPGELMQRVRATLINLDTALAQIDEQRGRLLALEDRLTVQRDAVAQHLAATEAARAGAERLLFIAERAPLWEAFRSAGEHVSLAAQLETSWQLLGGSLHRFWVAYHIRIWAHLAFSLLLFALMLFLRSRTRDSRLRDPSAAAPARILAYPISATLLIALASSRWIYPAAPSEVIQIALLLLPLPLLRLLHGITPAPIRPILYGLTIVYVLEVLDGLFLAQSLAQRLLLLATTLLAFAGLIWSLRPGGPCAVAYREARWRLPLAVARLGILLLGISLAANLFGNVSLAVLLTGGTLRSAYLAVLALAIVEVLDGIWRTVLYSAKASRLRLIQLHRELLTLRGVRLIHVTFAGLWILSALTLFGVLRPLADGVLTALRWRWSLGTVDISLGDVLGFIVVLGVSFLLSRFIRFVLDEGLFPHLEMPRGVPAALSTGTHYLLLVFGFYLALGAAGVDLTKFTLLAGALGVGVGFGLQNLISNFISGIMLLFERPINPGDTIEVGSRSGEVKRIGIRSTTLRTFEGADVIIPNATLISQEVVNWTLTDRLRRVEIPVGAAYGTDPEKVTQLLLAVLAKYPDVLPWPKPMALFQGMGESSLNFVLRFWTGNFDGWVALRSDVATSVYSALRDAGIEVPFPQRDLHLRSVDAGVRRLISDATPGDLRPQTGSEGVTDRKE